MLLADGKNKTKSYANRESTVQITPFDFINLRTTYSYVIIYCVQRH